MNKLQEIEGYFNDNPPPDQPYRLNVCTMINNPKKFVKSHISYLKANSGNLRFMPYFERLNTYYEHVKKAR